MHTDARSAKKDVISTKPRKAMVVVRIRPRAQKSTTEPPSQVTPAICRRSRGMLSCVSKAGRSGFDSPVSAPPPAPSEGLGPPV